MSEVKVNLTIILQGGVMMSEQECSKQLKEPILVERGKYKGKVKKDKDGNPMFKVRTVPDPAKTFHHEVKITDRKNKVTEVINFWTRGYKPAKQSLNICQEAYDYFISNEVPDSYRAPEDFKPNKKLLHKGYSKTKQAWMAMPEKEKLEWHLNRICAHRNGIMGDYTVFND
jgi:hypothetical protein